MEMLPPAAPAMHARTRHVVYQFQLVRELSRGHRHPSECADVRAPLEYLGNSHNASTRECTQARAHMQTLAHRHTDTQTHTHAHTDTQTHRRAHTQTHTRAHADTRTHRHTDTQTQTRRHATQKRPE
eukprot:332082-Alexandrium_andersonii.AAC.1